MLAGLCTALLSLPATAFAAVTPESFTLPSGYAVSNFGVAVDGAGEAICLASSAEEIDDLAWSPRGDAIAFGVPGLRGGALVHDVTSFRSR